MTDPDTRGWRTSLRRHDALVFYVLTLALTWVVWIPRAMGIPVGVVGQLWTWIPAIAAPVKWVVALALFVRLPRSFGAGRGSGPAAAFQRSATSG